MNDQTAPKDLSKLQPAHHGEFHCAMCHCGLLKCVCAYGHHNEPIRTQMCGCYPSAGEKP
jgi:hypothetical protein